MKREQSMKVDTDVWKKITKLAKQEGCWKKSIIRRAIEKMEKEK